MAKDNSSLPLFLTITGAVVGVAVGGWFFLDQEPPQSAAATPPPSATLERSIRTESIIPTENTAIRQQPATTAEPVALTDPPTVSDSPPSAAEVNLRKARLAAQSDILVFPEESSALHYYGLVLGDDPGNAVARAERETVLAEVEQVVIAHLGAEEFNEAYGIAGLVARQVPDHSLVVETQRVLDERTKSLVDDAIQLARDGNDSEANDILATAESLPGRNPDYFVAVRESITEIRNVRNAAEQERRRRAQLANEQARDAWQAQVRGAIGAGNLISPSGASAIDLLAEGSNWAPQQQQLTGELRVAMVDSVNSSIGSGELEYAEQVLDRAYTLGGPTDDLDPLRSVLENAFVENQSHRVMQVGDLTRVKTTPPKYPKRAIENDISGWVEIYFTVTPQGETTDIEIRDSEPSTIFNKAAMKAVEQWQFEPVEYRGQIISQRVATRLAFELN